MTYTMDDIAESKYVLGCRKEKQYKVIDVMLPDDWEIPAFLFPEDAVIFVDNDKEAKGFYFFTETKTFSDIYYVVRETIRVNKEKEEKLVILNQLQAQLQSYFDKISLSDFKKLTFISKDLLEVEETFETVGEPSKEVVPPLHKETPLVVKKTDVKNEEVPRP